MPVIVLLPIASALCWIIAARTQHPARRIWQVLALACLMFWLAFIAALIGTDLPE